MTREYTPPPNGFRTFLIVWVTQSISVFGSALTLFALNIWLLQSLYPRPEQKPQLALAISAMSLCFTIPIILGAPLAGAWADRHDRKRTMLVTDFVSGLLSLAYMTLVVTHLLNLVILLVLITLSATAASFHEAAFDTSYAMLVPEDRLPRANGMMQSMWSLSGIISPVLAAGLIALPAVARQRGMALFTTGALASLHDGTSLAMGIDALTFFMASGTLFFLSIPSPRRTDLASAGGKPAKSFWADIKEGGLYIWHRRPMLWLLGTFTVVNFLSGPVEIFLPLMVKFNLQADWLRRGFTLETALASIASVGAFGGLAGGLLISLWGGLKKKRIYGVVGSMVFFGLGMIVFGTSAWLYVSMASLFLFNMTIPVMNSHSQAIWQTQTPHELQGRVFSVRRLIAQFSWPLSTALAGVLGGAFNPGTVIAVLGALLVVFTVAQLFNPLLLRVEDKEYLDRLAARAATGE